MSKILNFINNQFWNVTFKTGIYDALMMSSYDMSLKTIIKSANITENRNILDVGCGSGRLLLHIGDILTKTDSKWTGLELTTGGVSASKRKIQKLKLGENAKVLPADMTEELPVKKNSFDIAFSHFSMYVIPEREQRLKALRNINDTLKSDGKFYIVAPSTHYNAKDQLKSSLLINAKSKEHSSLKKFTNKIIYSTLGYWGEIIIAGKIQNGIWCTFTEDRMRSEVEEAGLQLEWSKGVYGDTALLFCVAKNMNSWACNSA
jgi:ubiquinone/menaquinone biosynthesis C-methylase UbiE